MTGSSATAAAVAEVVRLLRRRYGPAQSAGRSRLYRYGSALTCSINYSRLLGHKYFFGLARDVADATNQYPPTDLGDFVLLICGSAQQVLVLPRQLVLDAMKSVTSRRLDVFIDDGSYVLQTTKHPKLDVTQFLNAYPGYSPAATDTEPDADAGERVDRRHVKIQWALIRLGVAEGCTVWVPPGDRHLAYGQYRFAGVTLDRLPHFGFDENTRRIVVNIDVLWLTRNVIRKAFEIESTTSIYSGLLRLNDLVLAQPNNQIDLYIAADRSKRDKVHAQLMRPSFQQLIPKCQFISFDYLEEQLTRVADFPLESGARITGLVSGEYFSLPEHYAYPANI